MIKLLLEVYETFNQFLFTSSLPTVEFRVNLQRKQALYFTAPNIIELGEESSTANKGELLDELLHAMVHVSNHSRGVGDVTRNQYHKIDFCNEALRVGLFVQRHATRGWGITSVSRSNLDGSVREPKCQQLLNETIGLLPWDERAQREYQQQQRMVIRNKPQKQFQFKYVCQCNPPFIVRVGRRPDGDHPFLAKCLRCDANFVFEEQ